MICHTTRTRAEYTTKINVYHLTLAITMSVQQWHTIVECRPLLTISTLCVCHEFGFLPKTIIHYMKKLTNSVTTAEQAKKATKTIVVLV